MGWVDGWMEGLCVLDWEVGFVDGGREVLYRKRSWGKGYINYIIYMILRQIESGFREVLVMMVE